MPERAGIDFLDEILQFRFIAHDLKLDPSVGKIAHPSNHVEALGDLFGGITKAHSLDAPGEEVLACDHTPVYIETRGACQSKAHFLSHAGSSQEPLAREGECGLVSGVKEPSPIRSICVFCGAASGSDPAFAEAARSVGIALAERGIRLITGGGSFGLMGVVANACLDAGGEMVGVITRYLEGRELAHPRAQRMEVVETMAQRKELMAELSDAFITLPGGIGTLDELFEMLTWSRLAVHDKPSALLNVAGFYDELIHFTQRTQVEGGFISASDAANLLVTTEIPELFELLEAASGRGVSSLYLT